MICYQLNFARYREHLVDVSVTFTALQDNPVLWLPSWIAGSYLIREFSRQITAVTATIDGVTQRLVKLDKNHWQIHAKPGDKIRVDYEVYAYDLSVRGAYVDETRLYGNFTALALAVQGQEAEQISVELACPHDFISDNGGEVGIACALPDKMHQQRDQTLFQLTAEHYEQLIDSPFEIAEQEGFDFDVMVHINGEAMPVYHRFLLSGVHNSDLDRLADDLTKICQSYVDWLGDTPFTDYVFMTMVTGNDYGGLEHLASTSLITPRDDLPTYYEPPEPSENYQRFLGLCSHEYFHAWWVKTVRPAEFLQPDFSQEAYTTLLWVFEGFTSYVDDFMLQKSGVISQASYLKLLAEQINRYHQTHGRALQSVVESSFDAWIKLYRADENTPNAGISYYNKGALVALCLDLTLIEHGKRLFDVVKAFYDKAKAEQNRRFGMNEANLDAVMREFLPHGVWQDFKADYIDGIKELPLAELLSEQGVAIDRQADAMTWGVKTVNEALGLKVQRVIRGSLAAQAGVSANDVIVAIDGLKATEALLKATAKRQAITEDAALCHVFRRDELLLLEVPAPMDAAAEPAQPEKWTLTIGDREKMGQWLHRH